MLMNHLASAANAVKAAVTAASAGLVERRALVETVALAAVAGEHVAVVGVPGTAKSEAVRRIASALGGRYFEYLLGRFTEPSELFGPVDLRRLKEGVVETETSGMLPEADIAFLDEIFMGSTAILNTLLGILNERTFRRGHTAMHCPLRVCIGATNTLPSEEHLAAFADRFLIRFFVEPLADARLEELLAGGWSLRPRQETVATLADLDVLSEAAVAADMEKVRPLLATSMRLMRRQGIVLSDRRAVRVQRLIAAAAVLDGRPNPTAADLWPLILAVPTREAQLAARQALAEQLSASENQALLEAAEEASLGPRARANRLLEAGRELLAAHPSGDGQSWQLRLEGVAREIDAGFAPQQMPPDLARLRDDLKAALQRTPP